MAVDIEQVKEELLDVVNAHSLFDNNTQSFTTLLSTTQLSEFKTRFIFWLNSKLLADGINEREITRNYKRLTLMFHPDKNLAASFPALLWVEQQFIAHHYDNSFVILAECYNKLVHPEQYKKLDFEGINNIDDFRLWLEKEREHSTNTSYKNLCNQSINLINESHLFFDETGTLNPVALKKMVQFVPALITTYGMSFVVDKLLIIYSLYFVILHAGRQLERSNGQELQVMGRVLHQGTANAAKWNTALLCYLVENIFSLSRLGFHWSTQLNKQFLPSIVTLNNELVLVKKKQEIIFNHPELQQIAALFNDYLSLNNQQFFKSARIGAEKNKAVKRFLLGLNDVDKTNTSIADKLTLIESRLNILKLHTDIYTGNTAKTVDCALRIIRQLQKGVALGVVELHQQENNSALKIPG